MEHSQLEPALRLERVESRALHRRVADQLRAAIVSGSLAPGTWLREAAIAEQSGVSRGPVREALRALERDGLIVSYPYRGVRVIGVDVAEAIELFTPLRQTIEGFAARHLVGGTDYPEEGATLARVLALMDDSIAAQARATRRGDRRGVVDADLAFHRALCCESGLPLVAQLWHLIEPRIDLIFQARYAVSDPSARVDLPLGETHARIVAALRARDAEGVVELLRVHIATGMAHASATIQRRVAATRASEGCLSGTPTT